MATRSFSPNSLGRLAEASVMDFEAGMILWQRFCVVGEVVESAHSLVVPVTDLQREYGHRPSHRVELHIPRRSRDTYVSQEDRARLHRAYNLDRNSQHRSTQPRAHADFESGEQFVLVCDPVAGDPVLTGAITLMSGETRGDTLDSQELLHLGSALATLLVRLHAQEIYGVQFSREALRVEGGRYFLANYDHLFTEEHDYRNDLRQLCAFLEEVGGSSAWPMIRPAPSNAHELSQRIRSMAGERQLETIELPSEPPFVGREKTMSFLTDGLSRARIAQPTAVVIRGNRGVGKSRLLREFISARLEAGDAFVLAGTWQPRSADTRGGLLGAIEQVTKALRTLEPEEREQVRGRINRSIRNLGAIVTRSAPSLGSLLRVIEELPPLELSGDFNRHTSVIADLLRAIGSQKRPLVLVLDNLENADSRSLAVLKILTQLRPAHHTLVIAGLRDEKQRYKPEFETEVRDLRPLQIDEINTLLNRTLLGTIADQDLLAETLMSVSGGYPLAIWANLRAWIDRSLLIHEVGDSTWRARRSLQEEIDHEPDVRDLFGFRLAGAASEVRTLALRAAVLGLSITTAELHSLTADDEDHVNSAIRDLVSRGILTPTSIGVSFPHDSIRELVLESVDASQRREAHRAAAQLLLEQDAPLAQIAYHRELGFEADTATLEDFDRLSVFHVEAGHERLAIYDLERARWHLECALERSRDPKQRSLAAEALADVYLLSDDFENAIEMFSALIAGTDPAHAVRAGAKAVHYLFFKSRADDAQVLGDMALEVVGEPTPRTTFGKILSVISSLINATLRKPPHGPEIRDALCGLYPHMVVKNLGTDPLLSFVCIYRGRWMAQGLRTASAALTLSFEASIRATIGHFSTAEKRFQNLTDIAKDSGDPWARGIACHTRAHTLYLPSLRYEEGQDLLDDAIAAFRETGDMSVAVLSLLMKALYGKNHERADKVLGWLDEAIAMGQRNGKTALSATLESIRVCVLARQGRTDVSLRIQELAQRVKQPEIEDLDRLLAQTSLALAALYSGERKLGYEQALAGQAIIASVPGVPEFLLEHHFATAMIILDHQLPSRDERKLLRKTIRKLKSAASASPRLTVHYQVVLMRKAMVDRKPDTARKHASEIIAGLDSHGDLFGAREAHRTLAQINMVDNVSAAKEHENIASKFGKRLGLSSRTQDNPFEFDDSSLVEDIQPNLLFDAPKLPQAGLLDEASTQLSMTNMSMEMTSDHSEILDDWGIGSEPVQESQLREVVGPLKDVLAPQLPGSVFDINCSNPDIVVPVSAGDLQVLIINLVLSSRDAVGDQPQISLDLELEELSGDIRRNRDSANLNPGRYLLLRVLARGSGTHVPVIGGFKTCEALIRPMNGELTATAGRARTVLLGRIPLEVDATIDESEDYGKVLVVHPEVAIRDTVRSTLAQLNVEPLCMAPREFEPGLLEGATLMLADGETLRKHQVLEPLVEARMVEIVKRGVDPVTADQRACLRVPFMVNEIEALLKGDE